MSITGFPIEEDVLANATFAADDLGAGSRTRTLGSKSRDVPHIFDWIPTTQHSAILGYTTTYDALADFYAACEALSDGRLLFPRGKLVFSDTIHLKWRMWLIGQGAGYRGDKATRFFFPVDKDGIVVHLDTTDETGRIASDGMNAAGSIIQGINLVGGSNGATTGSGVWMRARAKVIDCGIEDFAEHGVKILASLDTLDDFEYGNANGWRLDNVACYENGENGVHIEGFDVNTGVSIGLDLFDNGGIGLYDAGFLGNCHILPQFDNNLSGIGMQTTDVNAHNLILLPHTEGQSTTLSRKTLSIGGNGSNPDITTNETNTSSAGTETYNTRTGFSTGIDASAALGANAVLSMHWHLDGNRPLNFHYTGDASQAYNVMGYSHTFRGYVRTHDSVVMEWVTGDLVSQEPANGAKYEDGTWVPTDKIGFTSTSLHLPSMTVTGGYRRFVYEQGELAADSAAMSGDETLTIAQLAKGRIVRDPNGSGRTLTFPTAANIVAGLINPRVSQIVRCLIINGADANEVLTLAAGSGGAFDANQTAASRVIPQNASKHIEIRLTNVSGGTEAYVLYA